MRQFIGGCDATASAGPDGKVMIVSHLTNTDGHKVPGTTLENMQWLQLEATTFYLFLRFCIWASGNRLKIKQLPIPIWNPDWYLTDCDWSVTDMRNVKCLEFEPILKEGFSSVDCHRYKFNPD